MDERDADAEREDVENRPLGRGKWRMNIAQRAKDSIFKEEICELESQNGSKNLK